MIVCVSSLLASVACGNNAAVAMRVNQAQATVTVGSTLITQQVQPQQLINQSFTVISTTGTNLPCELWNLTFTGYQGQYLAGNFTSLIPLDFYVVQDTIYQNWAKQGTCGNVVNAVASQLNSTSYSFSAALPSSGKWDIVLVNSSSTRDAAGFMTAQLSSGSYTMTEVMLSTITATTPSVSTPTYTSPQSTGVPGFPVESIILGMITGLVAITILRHHQRLRR